MGYFSFKKQYLSSDTLDHKELYHYYIDEGAKNITSGSFWKNHEMASVCFPNTVKKIYGYVCAECDELVKVILPKSITYIGPRAFSRCHMLSSVTIPENVELTGYGIFSYCKCLSSVSYLGYEIADSAFIGSHNITSIFIGENVIRIDSDNFDNCKKIKSLVVDVNNKFYDSRNNCNAIIETNSNTLILGCNTSLVPYGVKKISKRAFKYCGRMKNIVLPDSLEYIGSLPSSIQKIYIPKGSKDKFRLLLPNKKSKLIELL